MKPEQIQQCADQLAEFHGRLAPLFYEKRQAHWCQKWLHGLLLDGVRKNATGVARAVPGANVQAMQQFLADSTWDRAPLIEQLQVMAQEGLGEPDGILVCDDTGFPKKGTESVGVARQYSGTLGKVDNCQIGVFLAYVTGKGRVLVDGRLYLPKDWAADRARRKKAGVPRGVRFQTKAALALEMIERAVAGALSVQWVTCDDGYGRDGAFRQSVAALGLRYVCEVPSDQKVWCDLPTLPRRAPGQMGRPRTRLEALPGGPKSQKVRQLASGIDSWRHIQLRAGTKKPVASDWAGLRIWPSHKRAPGPEEWLLLERGDAGMKYYLSNAPAETPLEAMARVAKREWYVEPCFRDLKQEVGLDDYEARKWRAWHHHVTLCMLAGLFLTLMQGKWQKGGCP